MALQLDRFFGFDNIEIELEGVVSSGIGKIACNGVIHGKIFCFIFFYGGETGRHRGGACMIIRDAAVVEQIDIRINLIVVTFKQIALHGFDILFMAETGINGRAKRQQIHTLPDKVILPQKVLFRYRQPHDKLVLSGYFVQQNIVCCHKKGKHAAPASFAQVSQRNGKFSTNVQIDAPGIVYPDLVARFVGRETQDRECGVECIPPVFPGRFVFIGVPA